MDTLQALIELARLHPGQPISLICEDDQISVGILSIMYPEGDDWYHLPIPIERFKMFPKSTGKQLTEKGSHRYAILPHDPRRTRTYNQLIKSQLLCQLS